MTTAAPEHTKWTPAADEEALSRTACQRVMDAASRAIAERGSFLLVMAGGNSPRNAYRLLRNAETDWSRWRVYFSDERCLPANDERRNSRMAQEALLKHVPIAAECLHAIPAERGAEAAARDYAQTLKGVGAFDLVLLGLGEDGHTASLFAGHDLGVGPHAPDVLAVLHAPKPPAERVSLSAARLSRTRDVLFLVSGESKRNAVALWRAGVDIPARAIQPPASAEVLVESALLIGL